MFETGIDIRLTENVTAKLAVMIPLLEKVNSQFLLMNQMAGNSVGLRATASALGQVARNAAKLNAAGAEGLPATISQLSQLSNRSVVAAEKVGLLGGAFRGVGNAMTGTLHLFSRLGLAMFGISMIKDMGMTLAKPALEVAQIKAQMGMSGLWTPALIEKAESRAKQLVTEVPGTSVSSNLEAMKETGSVFADPNKALLHAKALAQTHQIMNMMMSRPGGEGLGSVREGMEQSVVKMAEQHGAISDPKEFNKLLTGVVASIIQYQGTVSPQQLLLQFTRQGSFKYAMDIGNNLFMLSHKIQEMSTGPGGGGGRGMAGTQSYQFMNVMSGGPAGKQFLAHMQKLGFVKGATGQSADMKATLGHPVTWGTQTAIGQPFWKYDLLRKDPVEWAKEARKQLIEPAYPGFEKMPVAKQGDILNAMTVGAQKNFRQQFIELLMGPSWENLSRQMTARGFVPGTDIASSKAANAVGTKMDTIPAKWNRLLTAMGENTFVVNASQASFKAFDTVLEDSWHGMEQFNDWSKKIYQNPELQIFINRTGLAFKLAYETIGPAAVHLVGLFKDLLTPAAMALIHAFDDAVTAFDLFVKRYGPQKPDPTKPPDKSKGFSKLGEDIGTKVNMGHKGLPSAIGKQLGAYAGEDWHVPGFIMHPLRKLLSGQNLINRMTQIAPIVPLDFNLNQFRHTPIRHTSAAGKNKISDASGGVTNHITINNYPASGTDAQKMGKQLSDLISPHTDRKHLAMARIMTDSAMGAGGNYQANFFGTGNNFA